MHSSTSQWALVLDNWSYRSEPFIFLNVSQHNKITSSNQEVDPNLDSSIIASFLVLPCQSIYSDWAGCGWKIYSNVICWRRRRRRDSLDGDDDDKEEEAKGIIFQPGPDFVSSKRQADRQTDTDQMSQRQRLIDVRGRKFAGHTKGQSSKILFSSRTVWYLRCLS